MSTQYLSIQLPCKPYIQKYVGTLYGTTLKADLDNPISDYVQMALEKTIYEARHFGDSILYKDMTASLTILVNEFQAKRIGYDLSTESIININRFIENNFKRDLCLYCMLYVLHNSKANSKEQGYKVAVEKFAEQFGIEIDLDISFDGLKKMEYRKRKRDQKKSQQNANISCAEVSPIFRPTFYGGVSNMRPHFK